MRKGFYFSLDAVMALMIMSTSMVLVLQASQSSSSGFQTDSSRYSEVSTEARDALKLASIQDYSSLQEEIKDDVSISGDAANKSVLNAITLLWAGWNRTDARELTRQYFRDKAPPGYEFAVKVSESGNTTTLYRSSEMKGSPSIVTSNSLLVSGHRVNRSQTGVRARSLLTEVDKNTTKRVFFGGYVGQGNITYNVSLDRPDTVKNVSMEMDVTSNFTLQINGQEVGQYTPDEGTKAVEEYQICTTGEPACEALENEQNTVKFLFTSENRSIRGGVLRIRYNKTANIQLQGPKNRIEKKRLPGINGIINYYGSFYVPGNINDISARLNLTVQDRKVFVRAGSTTLYEETLNGNNEITLSGQEIEQAFNDEGIQLEDLSQRTVPLRIGLGDINTESGTREAIADSISVMDISGSMEGDRLTQAKNASRQFVDIILEADGNRAGFVSYNEAVVDSSGLSKDKAYLKNLIDSQTAGGNTCIGCGILEATDTLQGTVVRQAAQSGDQWSYTPEFLDTPPPEKNGNSWNENGFDDSNWTRSASPITSQGPDPELEDYQGEVYFRREFSLNHSVYTPRLGLYTNDRAVAYLNGEQIFNGTASHLAQYWNREVTVSGDYLRSGGNVLAVKLVNEGNDTERIRENRETGWTGSFTNTTVRNGRLQLAPQYGTGQDVNADQYVQITGDGYGGAWPFVYESYIERVQIRGIDSSSGNEGYRDATDQVTEELVPGRTYQVNMTLQTGDGSLYASAAFDWNGNGRWDDTERALEVGSCSGNPCTVSGEIRIPEDAETGSTLMRVMVQETEYHRDPTSEDTLMEAEDYSAFIDSPTYHNGTYTATLQAPETVDWTGKQILSETPGKTALDLNYTVSGTTYENLSQVPESESVDVKASLFTKGNETPVVEEFSLGYPIDQQEAAFDAYLNLTEDRKRSMVVMSDGAPNIETSMENVPNHYEGNDFCFGGSCYPVIGAPEHAIEAACRAQENRDVKVYSVGFGDANEEIMGQIAECGGGQYYSASTSNLADVFTQISNRILEASYVGQTVKEGTELSTSTLYPDSYFRFNYTDTSDLEYGKISLRRSTAEFGEDSPKRKEFDVPNGTVLEVPQDTEVDSAKATSFSGNKWTYTVEANGTGSFEKIFDLTNYGTTFPALGDPFTVNIPPRHITVGNNAVKVNTALEPGETSGGNPNNRVFYTIEFGNSVPYGDLYPNSTAARKNATWRLRQKLDFDDDGEPIVDIESDDFRNQTEVLGKEPYLWGPANVKLVIWSEE